MKELLKEERPYEKCGRFGAKSLTDIELLAVLLRSGTKGGNVLETAKAVLYPDGKEGGLTRLPSYSKEALMKIPGRSRRYRFSASVRLQEELRKRKQKSRSVLTGRRRSLPIIWKICVTSNRKN